MKVVITKKEYDEGKNMILNFVSELYDIDSTVSGRKESISDKMETIKEFDDTLNKTVTINDKAIDLKIDSNNGIDIKIDEDLVSDICTMLCNPALVSIMRTMNRFMGSLKSIIEVTIMPTWDALKEKYLKNFRSSIKVTDNSVAADKKDEKKNDTGFKILDEGVEMIKNASEISMEELGSAWKNLKNLISRKLTVKKSKGLTTKTLNK